MREPGFQILFQRLRSTINTERGFLRMRYGLGPQGRPAGGGDNSFKAAKETHVTPPRLTSAAYYCDSIICPRHFGQNPT